MNRYYLKALGTICYDKTGLTYPEQLTVDLEKIAKLAGASEIHWEQQFGFSNLPEVLCFGFFTDRDSFDRLSMFTDLMHPFGLMVKDHWSWESKNEPW